MSFPSLLLRHIARNVLPSFSELVIHIWSFNITGDEKPSPGTGIFHLTFFPSSHSMGIFFAFECPCPSGPRNCGQSALNECGNKARKVRIEEIFFMINALRLKLIISLTVFNV